MAWGVRGSRRGKLSQFRSEDKSFSIQFLLSLWCPFTVAFITAWGEGEVHKEWSTRPTGQVWRWLPVTITGLLTGALTSQLWSLTHTGRPRRPSLLALGTNLFLLVKGEGGEGGRKGGGGRGGGKEGEGRGT